MSNFWLTIYLLEWKLPWIPYFPRAFHFLNEPTSNPCQQIFIYKIPVCHTWHDVLLGDGWEQKFWGTWKWLEPQPGQTWQFQLASPSRSGRIARLCRPLNPQTHYEIFNHILGRRMLSHRSEQCKQMCKTSADRCKRCTDTGISKQRYRHEIQDTDTTVMARVYLPVGNNIKLHSTLLPPGKCIQGIHKYLANTSKCANMAPPPIPPPVAQANIIQVLLQSGWAELPDPVFAPPLTFPAQHFSVFVLTKFVSCYLIWCAVIW